MPSKHYLPHKKTQDSGKRTKLLNTTSVQLLLKLIWTCLEENSLRTRMLNRLILSQIAVMQLLKKKKEGFQLCNTEIPNLNTAKICWKVPWQMKPQCWKHPLSMVLSQGLIWRQASSYHIWKLSRPGYDLCLNGRPPENPLYTSPHCIPCGKNSGK